MGQQKWPHFRSGLWRAEQIALHFRTPERAQQALLRFSLDAFSRGRHVAGRGNVDDRLHDAGRSVMLRYVVDEAAIDLDLVEGEALQIAQRRIAGAEVVERDADADGAEL